MHQRLAGDSMRHDQEGPQEASRPEGRYANYFEVGHNAFEFLLDFGQCYPDHQHVRLHTRIVTSPIYAKVLLETLRESLDRYEQTFGTIRGP